MLQERYAYSQVTLQTGMASVPAAQYSAVPCVPGTVLLAAVLQAHHKLLLLASVLGNAPFKAHGDGTGVVHLKVKRVAEAH